MELREHLLKAKRFYEEEEKKYKGPDPLKIRCEFISCLERYDKASIEDIYLPFLEETLKQFVEYPIYKQDLRFIQLWLNYSATQPNPVEVMERMHSKGLGTECGILYSSWAKLLIKRGLLSNADSVFKMGLTNNVKAKSDLQKQYDEFLRDVGQKALLGQLVCPKCGSSCKNCTGNVANPEGATGSSDEEVLVWEWNPLKVGDKDDFKCPMAYFEEPDSSKIRMYPRDKVYPASGDEFSLEEILAEEYERKYEEEARLKVLAEAKAREEESRRARQELNELRKIEAEKFNSISELNPPATTSKMLNLKPDIDNTLANSTTFTVHMKEAMNVVQCMWSSPTPSEVRPSLFRSETGQKDLVPQAPPAKPTTFEIFSEDDPSHQTPKHHKPFQIYDENADQRAANRQPAKPKIPFEIYDENAPPNQDMYLPTKQPSALKHKTPFEIYDEMKTPNEKLKNVNAQNPNSQPTSKFKLFPDEDNVSDLPEKLETQAKLQPFFNVQDKNDDFSDITCNTKAFEFVLPSSTPVSLHKKPLHSLQKFEGQAAATENTRLSVILESSKDKSTNSSSSSLASGCPRTPKNGPVLQFVPENFDPFSSSVIEELLGKVGFPKDYHLNNYFVKQTNLPSGTKSMKLGDDVYTIVGEIGKGAYAKVLKANIKSNTVALKIEKPACKWEYYIAKEIQNRIPPKFAAAFMDINAAYIFNNGSVLETQYAKYGSLLRNINLFKEKTGKSLDLGVILHYCIELVDIVQYLHKSKIIHADLKPDNIVVREIPVQNEPEPCIQLIDFGRCIDMSLLPPNIEFDYMFKTEDNKCIEMKEKKPWTYQIDLQGLASIFHCLLVSDYMKVQKKNERWCLQKTLLRTVNREFWNPIFDSLLNVNPSTDLPFDLTTMRKSLVNLLESSLNLHLQQISIYSNVISGK